MITQPENVVTYHELKLVGKNINLLTNSLRVTEVIDVAIELDTHQKFDLFTDEDGRHSDVLTFKKPKDLKVREFNGC
jgi:hypothetical protein